jgi:ADP-ribose pyrophosphatase YjhB (NUDIX family)
MSSSSREFPARPTVGIGVAVLRDSAVLMVRRGRAPAEGSWSLPGGAQKLGETVEQAARRELAEETGLLVEALFLAGCVDSIHGDPDGRIRYHYTILDFCARYAGGQARPGGDAAEVKWVDMNRLDELNIWSEAQRIIRASGEILK